MLRLRALLLLMVDYGEPAFHWTQLLSLLHTLLSALG